MNLILVFKHTHYARNAIVLIGVYQMIMEKNFVGVVMSTKDNNGLQVMNLNQFLEKEFRFCFRCGSKKYCQFEHHGHMYRLCYKCYKSKSMQKFFSITLQKEGSQT